MAWNFFRSSRRRRGFLIEPEEIFIDSLNPLGFDQERHEGRLERSIAVSSTLPVILLIGAGLFALFGRVAYLQIMQGPVLAARALEQSLVISTTPPPRGQIVDRNGMLLAGNIQSFDLVLYKSEFLKEGGSLDALRENLKGLLGVSNEELLEGGFPESVKAMFAETTVARGVNTDTIVRMQSKQDNFPGIFPEDRFRRKYEMGSPIATLIGYVGGLTKGERDAMPELPGDALVGKLGLEKQYNDELIGDFGKKIIQVDALRHVQKVKTIEEPKMGKTLELAIDGGLQEKAYEVLGSYIRTHGKRAGAVVALDPRDGAVRALVSYPSFDANIFSRKITSAEAKSIFSNSDKPLFNRAVSGEYPPGSTIKPVMASAALSEDIIDPRKQIFSAGFIQIPNPFRPGEFSIFKDWKPLGWMDMRNALAFSSNVYFYSVGGGYEGQQGLGVERIKKYDSLFGLGQKLGIDFPNEGSGFVPDPLWKAEKKPNDPIWRIGDTYNISIGQGDMLATPLQVASYVSAIANDGTLYKPRIVSRILDAETKEAVEEFLPEEIRNNIVDASVLSIVREGMRMAATIGSARLLGDLAVDVAGKTGTAETGRLNETHAWFAGFAPYENPELVLAVLVEKGGEGSVICVPIAKEIFAWYFSPDRVAQAGE